MREPTLVALAILGTACVEVPRQVRADFAEATPNDPSNFRKGPHGLPPSEAGVMETTIGDAAAAPAPGIADAGSEASK